MLDEELKEYFDDLHENKDCNDCNHREVCDALEMKTETGDGGYYSLCELIVGCYEMIE